MTDIHEAMSIFYIIDRKAQFLCPEITRFCELEIYFKFEGKSRFILLIKLVSQVQCNKGLFVESKTHLFFCAFIFPDDEGGK